MANPRTIPISVNCPSFSKDIGLNQNVFVSWSYVNMPGGEKRGDTINVSSNLFKSVCAQNSQCATFYQHSSIFGTICMKYVLKLFLKKIYVSSKFSCVRSSHDLCECAQVHSLEHGWPTIL